MDPIGEPTLVTSLRLQRGEVTCVSTAGARLATGSGDGTLRLWTWHRDVTWVEQAEYPRAHRYGITGAKFASSGLLLATVGVDGAARLWAVHETLVVRRTLAAPDAAAARSLQWAMSERLIVGHDDGGIRVWAIWSGTLLAHVRPHEGAVYAIATPAAAALLLTACTDGVLKVFELDEVIAHGREGDVGPPPLLWEDGAHDLGALCATDCFGGAATGGHDGRVRVWRVRGAGGDRQVVPGVVLTGHTAAVTGLSWVRDVLASASLDRTARLWNSDSAVCIRVLHAHSRYLTCVTLASDLRYMITASNDKSIRTWSLGNFSFNDDIEPHCNPLVHFGLGDLEGIGPVDDSESTDIEHLEEDLICTNSDIRCLARVSHVAAINAIAVSKDHIATACSDGFVRIFKWLKQDDITIELEFELAAHSYPVLAADFSADGALLLSGGLDGCARLWDVQSGCELMVVSAESVHACAGEGGSEGGGGVRDARLRPRRPPQLLVATDDGLAALWGIDPPSPDPLHVYMGLAEAAVCCAWAGDGRVLAVGGEAGELRLLAAPPCAGALCQETDAHDLGVLSCDFAPTFEIHNIEESRKTYLLATGGRDAFVKLWFVELEGFLDESIDKGSLKLAKTIAAHGGAVQCVRWGLFGHYEGALALATGGADRWARVWRVAARGPALDARAAAAVPAGAAGGAPAVRLLAGGRASLLAVGSLSGALALWQIPHVDALDETEGCEARAWGTEGVARWLKEYVTRPPGSTVSETEEIRLMEAIREAGLSGAQLLDKPIKDLMFIFGFEEELSEDNAEEKCEEVRARLLDEILWLRRDPLSSELEARAPHALRCPLSHAALREPARAADGYTYERRSLLHWLLAAGDADTQSLRSPMSGRRLRSARVEPNYGVRELLRQYCGWRQ